MQAARNNGEKTDELEQEVIELRGEIGTRRHVPPCVRVRSLSGVRAQNWADLCQAPARQAEGDEHVLQRLSNLEGSDAYSAS
jgi:mitotic spindle assembly checkpoint protein MAD1